MIIVILNCTHLISEEGISFKDAVPWILTLTLAFLNFMQLLKTESLKNELQKRLNIHKLQFEKEFELYQKTWEFASKLRGELNNLRMKHYEHSETINKDTTDDKKDHALNELIKARTTVKKVVSEMQEYVERNEPFFPKDVFEKISKYMSQSYFVEIINLLAESGATVIPDFLKENLDEAIKHLDDVSRAIRDRIGILGKN